MNVIQIGSWVIHTQVSGEQVPSKVIFQMNNTDFGLWLFALAYGRLSIHIHHCNSTFQLYLKMHLNESTNPWNSSLLIKNNRHPRGYILKFASREGEVEEVLPRNLYHQLHKKQWQFRCKPGIFIKFSSNFWQKGCSANLSTDWMRCFSQALM